MSDHHPIESEQVMWSGSVSNWHYAGKWFTIVILLILLIGSFFQHWIDNRTVEWIIRGILLLVAVFLIGWIRLDRASRKYLVTNVRVSTEFGIVSKQSTELRIQDIRSINFSTSGISGLVGIGRIEFSSAASDDAEVIFWNTPNAEKIRDLVRSLQTTTA